MRVVEPHQFSKLQKNRKKRRSFRGPISAVTLVVILAFGYLTFGQQLVHKSQPQPMLESEVVVPEPTPQGTELKMFTDEEFKNLYTAFAYPNTERLVNYPKITGNEAADEKIYEIAISRGYKLSAVPVSNIIKIDEPYLTDDDLLQQNAKIGWDGLQSAAQEAGIPIQITSAYRSIEFQRSVFLQEMRAQGVTAPGVADGYSDLAINRVMDKVAPPGFSRHHNGYTIDLACDGIGLYGFQNTSCYDWISENNFEIAKTHGWIPSYPEEAEAQGPEPEPWEFIWVGRINLYE